MSKDNYSKLLWFNLLVIIFLTSGCDNSQSIPETSVTPTLDIQALTAPPDTDVPSEILSVTTTPETLCVIPALIPSPRADHEMVFDRNREKIILFGGRETDFWAPFQPSNSSSRHVNETWEYDNCGWKRIETLQSPPNFDDFDIVYDSARNATVLLGQYTPIDNPEKGSLSMMWEYDGHNWRQMTEVTSLPPPRIYREMVFDSSLSQIVLFGGYGMYAPKWSDWLWDTWIFQNEQWRNVTDDLAYESVPPREFPIMVFDEYRNVTVLLASRADNFTSEFDGTTWDHLRDLPNSGNRPALEANRDMNMLGGDMVFDTNRGVVVAHGLSGTWEYDGTTWQKIELSEGPKSQWHAMAYDESRGVVVLFGGIDEDGKPIEGTWIYDGVTWHQE